MNDKHEEMAREIAQVCPVCDGQEFRIVPGPHLGAEEIECSACGGSGAAPEAGTRADLVDRIASAIRALEWADDDKLLPEDKQIDAAFPTRTGRHDLYAEAMRMVGAKRSKGALVALVNWLLVQVQERDKLLEDAHQELLGNECGSPELHHAIQDILIEKEYLKFIESEDKHHE